MALAKDRMRRGRGRLEDELRQSRKLLLAGESTAIPTTSGMWLDTWSQRGKSKGLDFVEHMPPQFVGSQANELSKWMNAESITRHQEEMNLEHPTLRRVLKVDDSIDMNQMTKSQLCSIPGDPTSGERALRVEPEAKL